MWERIELSADITKATKQVEENLQWCVRKLSSCEQCEAISGAAIVSQLL